MILNEEWYIIPQELEVEEIIHQNYIKHGSHLKVNPKLKEIKKSWHNWKILRNITFYFKCSSSKIRTSKPRKNYVVKHIESDYSR